MKFIPIIFVIFFVQSLVAQEENLSNGEVFDGEPYLVINPENSQHIVVAWVGHKLFSQLVINVKTSFDGGFSWSDEVEIPHVNPVFSSVDPCLSYSNSGDLCLSYIDYSYADEEGFVLLRKSEDGGLTWGEPTEVISMDSDPGKRPIDRPWMAIDQTGGVYDGRIYVTSINLQFGVVTPPPYNPYFTYSADGGEAFEDWRYLDTLDWNTGSLLKSPMASPVIGTDGDLHIVYPSWVLSHDPRPRYILASSNNGGVDFSYQDIYYVDDAPEAGTKKTAYQLRINPSNPNHLNFFYLGDNDGDTDILMRETFDKGASWSESIKINDDPTGNNRLQDLFWASYDKDGDLVVAWRDRRNSAEPGFETESEIWGAVRLNDVTEFSENFMISTELVVYDTILASAGNDFMCMEVMNDTISVAWGDVRDGSLDVWFSRLKLDGSLLSTSNITNTLNIDIYPNPVSESIHVNGNELESYQLIDMTGKVILEDEFESPTENIINLNTPFSKLVYLLRIKTSHGYYTENIVLK